MSMGVFPNVQHGARCRVSVELKPCAGVYQPDSNALGLEGQPEREVFGRNVRRARVEAGLTQRELGKLVGVAAARVSEIERGKLNVCMDGMVSISQIVHKSLHQLLMP